VWARNSYLKRPCLGWGVVYVLHFTTHPFDIVHTRTRGGGRRRAELTHTPNKANSCSECVARSRTRNTSHNLISSFFLLHSSSSFSPVEDRRSVWMHSFPDPPLDGTGLEYNIVPVVEVNGFWGSAPSPSPPPAHLFKPTSANEYQDYVLEGGMNPPLIRKKP